MKLRSFACSNACLSCFVKKFSLTDLMDHETNLRVSSDNSQNSPSYPPAPNIFLVACLPEGL